MNTNSTRVAIGVLVTLSAVTLRGDTVELKTGERLDGAFHQASAAGVVIEIAGQEMTIPLGKVQAIYLGAAKPSSAPTVPVPSGEALDALRALRSVTESGISYRDYAPRALDAKVKVDRYLASPTGDAAEYRGAIEAAMRAYQLASQAWAASISNDALAKMTVGSSIDQDPVISKCPAMTRLIKQATIKNPGPSDRALLIGAFAGQGALLDLMGNGPSTLWICASDQVVEAERLLTQPAAAPKAASIDPVPGPPRAHIANQ